MRPILLLVLATACTGLRASRREDVPPRPLDLDPGAPLPVTGKCTWPGRVAAPGAIPPDLAPQLEQGVELIELRGDLRLGTRRDERIAAAWSRDGRWYATGDSSGVFVWEVATGALRNVFPLVPHRNVQAVALSAAGEQVAFITADDGHWSVFVASVAAPHRLRRFDSPPSDRLGFSRDGTRLLIRNTVWELSTGTRTEAKVTPYNSILLPDGVHVVDDPLSPPDDALELRELTGRVLHRFPGGRRSISNDGSRIAIGGNAGIDVYDLATGRRVREFPQLALSGSADVEESFVLSPDGARLLFSRTGNGELSTAEMWDVETGARLWDDFLTDPTAWRFSDDGRYLLFTLGSTWVMVRAEDGAKLSFEYGFVGLSPDSRWHLVEHQQPSWPELVPVDPHGGSLDLARAGWVLGRSRDGKHTASIDADGQLQLESDDGCVALGIQATLSDQATFSADGQFLFVADRATAYAWRTADGAAVRAVKSSGTVMDLLADTGRVLVSRPELRRSVPVRRVLDLVTGQEVHIPPTPAPVLDPLKFDRPTAATHDGRQLYVARTPALELVDLANPARNAVLHPHASIVAVSPDDRFVAAAAGGRVDLWTRTDWRPQIDITHDRPVTRLAFSGDGRKLASADDGGLVRVTRTADGKPLARLRLPYDHVLYLWLSADGSQLEVDTARGLRVRARLVAP